MSILRLLVLLFFCLATNSWAESGLGKILTKLDENYYYPQKYGVNQITAKIEWGQLDVVSGSGKFLRNPDFRFIWKKEGGIRQFEITGQEDQYSIKRKFELKNQIQNYGELIIPLTLREKFAHYRGEILKKSGGRVGLVYKRDSTDESVSRYHLLVNKRKMMIEKIRFKQRSAPYKVSGVFRYDRLDGKWIIAESESRFSMGELDYLEKSAYRYKKIGNIWLVHRIDQTLKQGNRTFQSHRFKISNVRVEFSQK